MRFNRIFGDIGSFGQNAVDITRVGAPTMKFKLVGKRGARQSVSAHTFHPDLTSAVNTVSALNDQIGFEIIAEDLLEESRHRVLLHGFTSARPRRIESTNINDKYIVVYNLEITPTSNNT